MLKRIDHIGMVVSNIEAAAQRYHELLGLELVHTSVYRENGVRVGFLACGNTEIELLEPLSSESSIGRFLEKRGEALHHLCFESDDINTEIARLKSDGVALIDQEPRAGAVGQICFLHPKAANGVLIELNQIIHPLAWRK